jgi:hypothetical protein
MAIVGIVTIAQMHAFACLDNKQPAVADREAGARSSHRGWIVPWHDTCEKWQRLKRHPIWIFAAPLRAWSGGNAKRSVDETGEGQA